MESLLGMNTAKASSLAPSFGAMLWHRSPVEGWQNYSAVENCWVLEFSARPSSPCWLHGLLESATLCWSSAVSWWDWERYYQVLIFPSLKRLGSQMKIPLTSIPNALNFKRIRESPFLPCMPCLLNGLLHGKGAKWLLSSSRVINWLSLSTWKGCQLIFWNDELNRCSIWYGNNLAIIGNSLRARIRWWMANSLLCFWNAWSRVVRRLDATDGRFSISSSQDLKRRERLHLQFLERLHQKSNLPCTLLLIRTRDWLKISLENRSCSLALYVQIQCLLGSRGS